jgi:hypothetical protein
MKQRISVYLRNATLAGFLAVPAASAQAATPHDLIYAVDQNNNLLSFYADAPQTIVSAVALNGLRPSENMLGIDYWQPTDTIYGIGSFNRLYTINRANGAILQVGGTSAWTPPINGVTYGVENDPVGVRIYTELGYEWTIDRTSGAVISTNITATAGVTGVAFNPNNGSEWGIDHVNNVFGSLNPVTGQLGNTHALGFDVSRVNGFDITVAGNAYLGSPAASSDPQANLYLVDIAGGGLAVNLGQIGLFGDGTLIRGLTMVPEPGTLSLLGLGGLGLLVMAFRRRK